MSLELLAIAVILVLQPLIAVAWVYLVYRVAVKFTRKQAEKAVDGRIERVKEAASEIKEGSA